MTHWSQEELDRIKAADDLHVAPFRHDGVTPGTPTWIWSVIVDGSVYARAYHGSRSRWFNAAITQGRGKISIAGMDRDVTFHKADEALGARIDAAYRDKYHASSYLAAMLGSGPRDATVSITPRK
jgi:hypothetical protein